MNATRTHPRHPFVVSLGLVLAAVAWLAGLFWIGVL